MKNRTRKPPEPKQEFGNLLSDLKVDNLPPPPEKEKPRPHVPSPEEIKISQLSPQDRELLRVFGGPSDTPAWKTAPVKKK